jgi:hypothetical protein
VEPGAFETPMSGKFDVAAACDDTSPFREPCDRVTASHLESMRAAPDASLVARAIADVAEDPAAPMRRLVGADAEAVVDMRGRLSDEEFAAGLRRHYGV